MRLARASVIAALVAVVGLTPVAVQGAETSLQTPAPAGRWTSLDSGTSVSLKGISFADPLVGHAVGAGGTILSTTNGGETWQRRKPCTGTAPCERDGPDRVTADLAGVASWDASRAVLVGRGGTVLITADGGRSWKRVQACQRTSPCREASPDRVGVDLTAVSVVAPSHAYAVGSAGTMLRSDDYGRSWRQLPTCPKGSVPHTPCAASPEMGPDLFGVAVTTSLEAYAVGADGTIVATSNGGRTVVRHEICVELCTVGTPRIALTLRSAAVPDTRRFHLPHGYVVGDSGALGIRPLTSNWTAQFACAESERCVDSSPDVLRADLRAVAFPHDSLGYAVGAGGTIVSLERSPDAGRPPLVARTAPPGSPQWRPQDSGTTENLNAVSFPTADVGYAAGEAGTILKLRRDAPGVRVSNVEPDRAPTVGGTHVTVTGTGFTGAHDVYFGPTRATGFKVESDSRISATVPFRPAGNVHVTVVTAAGPSAAASASRFAYRAPAGGRWRTAPTCPQGCRGPAVPISGGRVLVAGGVGIGLGGTASAELYDPVAGDWKATGTLSQGRGAHTVTLLADGRVLVAGGSVSMLPQGSAVADYTPLRSAELYDPASGTWTGTGDMTEARVSHTATLLADGRVLVTGGHSSATAEFYDPRSGTWSVTSPMARVRFDHSATPMGDGRVLVVGGCSESCTAMDASAELYDPVSGQWQRATRSHTAHALHTATALPDGSVLVAGGSGSSQSVIPFVERYEPQTDSWEPLAPMKAPRARHSATLLRDGRLLVVGGATEMPAVEDDSLNGTIVPWAEIYDSGSGRWSPVLDMPFSRAGHTALLAVSPGCGANCGKVLVVGGVECPACDMSAPPPVWYQPASAGSEGPNIGKGTGSATWLLAALAGVLALGLILLLWRHARRGGPTDADV